MDSPRQLTLLRDQKGLALVFIALLMVALCAFLGLAVDIGYMYVAKGQLQNAADSAALAGASALPDQTEAINRAGAFAVINPVVPGPDTMVAVSPGDITLGNWDSTRSSTPTDLRFQPGTPPINAVKVEAKRTEGSSGGPIDLFFSSVIGWSQMGVSATAIAQKPIKAGAYFMIDTLLCPAGMPTTPTTLSPPIALSTSTGNMAWTSLLAVPTAPGFSVKSLIEGTLVPDVDVCSNPLYSTNGVDASVFQDMEEVFNNSTYDGANKVLNGSTVSTWTVIVPFATNPTVQPDARTVGGYAKIRIIRACGSAGGPTGDCAGSEKDIVIDQITCTSCADSSAVFGNKPSLVQ